MEVILSELSRRTINNGYSFAGIGFIRIDDRDAIPQAADFLHLSDRTLRQWRQTLRGAIPSLHLLGRPAHRSPRDQRNEVIHLLDDLGPGIGLPTLPYFASMSARIWAVVFPALCLVITSRVMSVQTPHVAA